MDNFRNCYQQMCKGMPGGWPAMAAALGITKDALENRVYERRGQEISLHEAMQMQAFHGSTLFAEAVAMDSGGVFVRMPDVGPVDNEEIQSLYMELVEDVARLAREWREATRDGEVDGRERRRLERIQHDICAKTVQMNELTFQLFCRS